MASFKNPLSIMSDFEAENAVVSHRYTRKDVRRKEKMTLERRLTRAFSSLKELLKLITSVKV